MRLTDDERQRFEAIINKMAHEDDFIRLKNDILNRINEYKKNNQAPLKGTTSRASRGV